MSSELVPGLGGNSRFEILGRLGAGGMGTVYEVFDHERKERVALKTLSDRDSRFNNRS
jgi:serine/threonine protein kinase